VQCTLSNPHRRHGLACDQGDRRAKRSPCRVDNVDTSRRGNRSCTGDRIWILSDGPASWGTPANKASKSDTECHGVRDGVARCRSFCASRRITGTVPWLSARSAIMPTPCNSVPYSVTLRVGLACLALNPAPLTASQPPNAIALHFSLDRKRAGRDVRRSCLHASESD
jgi:hypothetical protein